MQNPAEGRVAFRKFNVPYPDFPYGIHSSSKAREQPERFLNHLRQYAGDKEVLECPLAATFKFYMPKGKRRRDLDQLVEDCVNAFQGYLYANDRK